MLRKKNSLLKVANRKKQRLLSIRATLRSSIVKAKRNPDNKLSSDEVAVALALISEAKKLREWLESNGVKTDPTSLRRPIKRRARKVNIKANASRGRSNGVGMYALPGNSVKIWR